MASTKPRGKYQGVSLPKEFLREVQRIVLNDNRYKSIAAYIQEAIREKMKKDRFWETDKPPENESDFKRFSDAYFPDMPEETRKYFAAKLILDKPLIIMDETEIKKMLQKTIKAAIKKNRDLF